MITTGAPPVADVPVRGAVAWWRFLAGFALLWAVLQGLAALDPTARWGLVVLAGVLVIGLVVERVLHGVPPRRALRALGFGRPAPRALVLAAAVSGLVVLVFPVAEALGLGPITLRPGWPWLLVGVFALHGLAEELVWRGYAFRRLRAGRSFPRAAAWTMPLVAVTHVPILVTSGVAVGLGAMAVAATTSIPFAYVFETGRGTVWAPALLHTAIDAFKLVEIPAAGVPAFSLLLVGVSILVPLLALAVPRRVLGR
ncbi:CPBP family intramembrane metalloprotease [Actinomycetospora lutea]|uniref:CPBP family intramembrane glutamic endopeptidase n=1 Tax=Actinomycetospora lutea TaxID=663604 RepID=UPI002365A236|nr:CPBP family intramembrane glutamic endopeptidase [Actinomycetospora lutea]MDD7939745.1 CPBP family intramembrane metalloprotease [Actinomycetospora lutea]